MCIIFANKRLKHDLLYSDNNIFRVQSLAFVHTYAHIIGTTLLLYNKTY